MAPDREPPPSDEPAGACVTLTDDGRIARFDAAATSLFGYTEHEAQGASYVELLVPAAQRAAARQWLAEGAAQNHEALRCRKDGERLWVAHSPCLERAHPTARTLVHRDLTEPSALAEAHGLGERWGALLDAVPEALLIADECGRIVLFNHAAEQLFGFARAALLGRPVELLLPKAARAAHAAQRRAYTGSPHTRALSSGLIVRGRRQCGDEFPAEVSLNPLPGGQRGGLVLGAVRDVSERESARRRLAEQGAQLSASQEAEQRFFASMSHDLRTPLNAIAGFTGILLMRLPGPLLAEQERQLQQVEASARELLGLIERLLRAAAERTGPAPR